MPHVNIGKAFPAAYQAMFKFSTAADETAAGAALDPKLVELIKIRTSQLNGCAYCLRMHTNDAIKIGETAERLAILPAWWESQYFTDAERAALQLAEQVTLISDHGRIPERGVDVSAALTEDQIAAVTWIVIALNAWNRIAVSSHTPVTPDAHSRG